MHLFYEVRKNDFSVRNNMNEVAFSSHIHSDIEILYIKSGIQHISINDKKYELKSGEAIIIFPNIPHSYFRKEYPGEPIDAILIICSKRFYRNFFPDMTDQIPVNPIIKKEDIHKDVKYAFESISNKLPMTLQTAWIMIILTHFFNYMELKETKKSPVEDISFKVIKYVEEHFTENITLESIADELLVSKNYISRVFSKKIKINFKKYINILRAEYAAKLIRTTNDKMTLIAEYAGFQSLATFNRIFHEIYGLSPREFKNNLDLFGK